MNRAERPTASPSGATGRAHEWPKGWSPPEHAAREWETLTRSLTEHTTPCVEAGGRVWDDPGSWSVAAELCAACPVLVECRAYAVAAREPEGLWGGLGPRERRT